jgi:hypothetical protein
MTGVGLLFWPARRRETVLVVEANRMVDFADRIAERLGGTAAGPPMPAARVPAGAEAIPGWPPRHDLTGELVLNPPRDTASEDVEAAPGRDRYRNEVGRITALEPNQRGSAPAPEGSAGGPAEGSAGGPAEGSGGGSALREGTGESPYVSTAT